MRFIGTKIITAEAMTRAAYVAFRGWQLPADEDGADEGYLVEYEPDGKPNVPGRAGYVTWTPKRAFDAAYRERPLVPGLLPHQQRVVDEKRDLDEKVVKLREFIDTEGKPGAIFTNLPGKEQLRLKAQLLHMTDYSTILADRIEAFTPA